MYRMLAEIESLPNDPESLKKLLIETQEKLISSENKTQHWKSEYEKLFEQFKLAQLKRFAASSEKNPLQDSLFDEADAPIEETQETKTVTVQAHERKTHPKRKPLPESFPREVIEHDVSDAEKQCDCGCQKTKFGESVTEQLDIIPPQIKVIRHVRPKYVCKKCEEGIVIAPMPKLLLPKCIASSGFMAYAVVSKYVDHLPLYRQEQIWKRMHVDIPRNSLCNWLIKTADQCEPLYQLIREHILSGNYIQADETPVQVLKEPDRKNTSKSYIWVYRGGPPNQIATYYEYQETRAGAHCQNWLNGFKGYLQSDGYKGYDWVDDHKNITHLACMVHARRPFAQLIKIAKKPGKSHEAIKYIQKLYQIESEVKSLSFDERKAIRLERAKPILDNMKIWLDKSARTTPPKGKLGMAIQYMLDRWQQLNHYLLDGQLQIDNNLIENDIRPFAIGKKNWLFKGSQRGARAGAIFYTLIATAKIHHLEPYRYLRYVFEKLPGCKSPDNYRALLPWNTGLPKLED